jgi:hypothetical protein
LNIAVDWAKNAEDTEGFGEQAEDLCVHYRAMAICLLVSEGDVDAFFHWLLHSPIMRKFFLARARAENLATSRHVGASFVDPVLDAVAARQWKLATDICALASPTWMEGFEYEDDFCYGDFIRRIVCQQTDGFDDLFARWHASLEGGHDTRLVVAKALRAGEASDFESNLRTLLAEREEKARAIADPLKRSILADELPFYPNRWVSIDGLALLALAERQGIIVDDEINACPRMVRTGEYAPFLPRAYPDLGID